MVHWWSNERAGRLIFLIAIDDADHEPAPDGSVFAFKRGGIAWLEGQPQPGRMVLQAFLPPKVLRELGEGAAR